MVEKFDKAHCKMWGCKMFILGLIVLANAKWALIRWDYLIGLLMVLGGIMKLAMPCKK